MVSSLSVFVRIVFQTDLATALLEDSTTGRTSTSTSSSAANATSKNSQSTIPTFRKRLFQGAEILSLLAVLGAVVVLGNQMIRGETMDGMSGIDLDKCRARQSFEREI